MQKVYSLIGSRTTSPEHLATLTTFARKLDSMGYWVRSGGARGADQCAADGAARSILYKPWKKYIPHGIYYVTGCDAPSSEAIKLASEFHPAWNNCSHVAKLLHGRNSHIILGKDLKSPSEFVLCYCPRKNGELQGGTALGIKIAKAHEIPVINLFDISETVGTDRSTQAWVKALSDIVESI